MSHHMRIRLASAAASVLVMADASAPASAAMMLSSTSGPSGGGNMITGTVAASVMAFPAGTTPAVQFQYVGTGSSTCGSMAKAAAQITANGTTTTRGVLTADPDTVRRLSTSKIAFQVPSGTPPAFDADGDPINPNGLVLAGAQASARWNVCVYDSDSTASSSLLATAQYTVAARPIIPAEQPGWGRPVDHGQRHRLQPAHHRAQRVDRAYILTVVANGDPMAGSDAKPSIISSGAAFTVSPY